MKTKRIECLIFTTKTTRRSSGWRFCCSVARLVERFTIRKEQKRPANKALTQDQKILHFLKQQDLVRALVM